MNAWDSGELMIMKLAIRYDSKTGNTKRLAEGLRDRLAESGTEVDIASISEAAPAPDALSSADAVLFGFWTDKGTCSPDAAAFLPELAGKRVFLFGTAGFGESPEYFERILGNVCAQLPETSTYLGGSMCQGQMGEAVKARYEAQATEHPDDSRWQMMLKTYGQALGHPDAADIDSVAANAKEALGL